MARIRTIKPGFFRHGELFDLEQETGLPIRVAYAGLWTACDRDGRFVWNPRELKLDCLPHDNVDFSRVLDALATRGFIVKYVVNGKAYGHVPSWRDHQVVNNREAESVLPEPTVQATEDAREVDASGTREPRVTESLVQDQGEGKGREKERKGREPRAATAPLEFDRFWQAYPRHEAKPDAERAFVKATKEIGIDAMLDALEKHKARWTDPQYIPHPASWLNKKRWLDDLPQTAAPRADRSAADTYAVRRDAYLESGTSFWNDDWGPRPSREEAAA